MSYSTFNPPANINDFDANSPLSKAWNDFMQTAFDDNINSLISDDKVPKDQIRFFNPIRDIPSGQQLFPPIEWIGFPNTLDAWNGEAKALSLADDPVLATWGKPDKMDKNAHFPFTDQDGKMVNLQYRRQDEYLEWKIKKDQNGKIIQITFTCEGPEYWDTIANDGDLLLKLYRQYVSQDVQKSDLYFDKDVYNMEFASKENPKGKLPKGSYNWWNKWNTTDGIMHLTHPSNTLGAEINLAARASALRSKDGRILSDAHELICCAHYGNANRHSDPQIGFQVNKAVCGGSWVSLRNPVGLYIRDIAANSFTKPDGSLIPDFKQNYWKVLRGQQSGDTPMILRATLQVPDGENFVLGDLFVDSQKLQYAGQVAKTISMGLYAFLINGAKPPSAIGCRCSCSKNSEHPGFNDQECEKSKMSLLETTLHKSRHNKTR